MYIPLRQAGEIVSCVCVVVGGGGWGGGMI